MYPTVSSSEVNRRERKNPLLPDLNMKTIGEKFQCSNTTYLSFAKESNGIDENINKQAASPLLLFGTPVVYPVNREESQPIKIPHAH